MPWLKLLHISAVILWCGALLYLPAAIAAARLNGSSGREGVYDAPRQRLLRTLFTLVATPAALLAIASGTAIFVFHGPLAVWLIAKLALVGLLVLGHAACGMLILRAERGERADRAGLRGFSGAIGITSLLWLAGIAWLVLAKPF
jgi:putative membrane protein